LTREFASVSSKCVKRVLATALSVGIAIVAPATASGAVNVTFKTWKVTTKNGKQHDVPKKGTFTRCGRKVVKLTATYDFTGATKGKAYREIWSLDDTDIVDSTVHWEHASGTAHVFLTKNGDPLDDGKFKLRLRQDGKGIGSNFITIRAKPPGGC
jgi:hypothetical protein